MALKYRKWDFKATDSGIIVCQGEHDKGQQCEYEEMRHCEVLKVLNDMRSKLLKMSVLLSQIELDKLEIKETIKYTETENAIMDMVAEQLNVDRDKITYKSKFIDDLGADSLDLIELLMSFEELLVCEVLDETAENMLTVKDCFDYCERENLAI